MGGGAGMTKRSLAELQAELEAAEDVHRRASDIGYCPECGSRGRSTHLPAGADGPKFWVTHRKRCPAENRGQLAYQLRRARRAERAGGGA